MHNHAADLCKSGDYHLGTRHTMFTLNESKVLTLDIAASEAECVQSASASPGVQVILLVRAGDQAEGEQVLLLLRPRLSRQAGR